MFETKQEQVIVLFYHLGLVEQLPYISIFWFCINSSDSQGGVQSVLFRTGLLRILPVLPGAGGAWVRQRVGRRGTGLWKTPLHSLPQWLNGLMDKYVLKSQGWTSFITFLIAGQVYGTEDKFIKAIIIIIDKVYPI